MSAARSSLDDALAEAVIVVEAASGIIVSPQPARRAVGVATEEIEIRKGAQKRPLFFSACNNLRRYVHYCWGMGGVRKCAWHYKSRALVSAKGKQNAWPFVRYNVVYTRLA